ncbi:Serine/threonine phosphatase stp [Defluviimonas aquaemixtae]|uniref:Serine/threonine phosphatase stp n=1 Tax=Albidovulum aquaemixtae TaxID=1542388 RepID=A0A2R8B7Z1_9RHOB|nr:protein phosphatase 2C domain-containing protein [Defluviimonas aquaemixtae]SPH18686.1 Serine/threonine phosphatase stp [Defluviimonas aquaemixtae]
MRGATTVVPLPSSRRPAAHGAGMTHRGCLRTTNEDAILIDPTGRLWAVADGMGGYGNGGLASGIVIDSLEIIQDDEDADTALRFRLEEANDVIRARAESDGLGPMGATVVALIIADGTAHVAWAGDSRLYLARDGSLKLITRDHSVVQDLVERGEIGADMAEHHPESHIVTRAVGGAEVLEVDEVQVQLSEGDRLLLCSDGLPRCLDDGAIADVLGAEHSPEAASAKLVRAALDLGAPDNVSVIVIDVRKV